MSLRLQPGAKLVLASHNKGKLKEFSALLAPYGINMVSAGELGLPEPEETGDSFESNALLKAQQAAQGSALPALADDSGFCVDGLAGAPGIYSARWAGPNKDFTHAMAEVNRQLGDTQDRGARFVCALCIAWPDGTMVARQGVVAGTVVWPPRGDRGFGYDPMFVPAGHTQSFGEMAPAEKEAISHRALAFRALVAAAFSPASI